MSETGSVWRVIAGQDNTIRWRARAPITGAPVLTVHHPTLGDVVVALTKIHADIVIEAVSTGRRRLTASAPVADMDGVAGEDGEAYLLVDGGDAYPVGVIDTDGAVVKLGRGLPTGVTAEVAAAATLQFATWSGTIPGAAPAQVATSALADPARWTLTYTEQTGADAPATARQAEGLLYVQAPPWPGTGLTTHSLGALDAAVGDKIPRGQADWAPQIAVALRDLRARLAACRADVQMGDALVDGELLHDAHGYLTLAVIYQASNPEYATYLRNEAQAQIGRVCHLLLTEDAAGALVPGPSRKLPAVGGTFAGARAFTEEAGER